MNILMDVAVGPMYAIMGGMILLVLAVVAAIVFVAVKLIKKAMNNRDE